MCGELVITAVDMIPPNTTLLKYDNPLLVTKNTDKKTPAVRNVHNTEAHTCFTIGIGLLKKGCVKLVQYDKIENMPIWV